MKIIGLDVGTKRIGVAKADSSVKIAVPQCTINVDGTELEQIARLANINNTCFFVVGLPRSNSGNETAQSKFCRMFAKKIKSKIKNAKIVFQDESLTSVEAENRLKERKKNYSKPDIDAEAATIILQDFLENFHKGVANSEEFKSSGVMPKPKKKHHASKKTKVIIISLISFFVIAIAGIITIYSINISPKYSGNCDEEVKRTNDISICEERTVTIMSGMTTSEISNLLESSGVIRSSLIFRAFVFISGVSSDLKAGTYSLSPSMSVSEIVDKLTDGKSGVVTSRITALPGATLFDFRRTLELAGFSDAEIDEGFSANYISPIVSTRPKDASLEGYIYGDTIEYMSDSSVSDIISKFLDLFQDVNISYSLESRFASHGLTMHEGITLASIVQKEANSPEDMAIVAGIFYNRLAANMPLGSDVTVQYAVDLVDRDRKIYTDNAAALAIDSCYNTRIHTGLPCGPVSNPGVSALKAVANPTNTDYLYFLTGDDGKMYYSSTYEEHESNISMYCQKLCNVSL